METEIKYLSPNKWRVVYELLKEGNPCWEIIGSNGISKEEYLFVVEKLNNRGHQ